MKNIQKKSLEHVSKSIQEINPFQIYNELLVLLRKMDLGTDAKNTISDSVHTSIININNKIEEAKEWIDSIISDLE